VAGTMSASAALDGDRPPAVLTGAGSPGGALKSPMIGLSSATEVVLCVDGSEHGAKCRFLSLYFELTSEGINKGETETMQRIKTDSDTYDVRLISTMGIERLMGVCSQVYALSQGSIIVYDVGDKESFDQCRALYEDACRTRDRERIPVLFLGMGTTAEAVAGGNGAARKATERQVPLAQAQALAAACRGTFHEIWDMELDAKEARNAVKTFVKDTVSFYSKHDEATQSSGETQAGKLPVRHVAVLGDSFVGKTTYVNKLVSGNLTRSYVETAAATKLTKKVTSKQGQDCLISLLDIPPNSLPSLSAAVVNKIEAIILVYSCTSKRSFERIEQLREKLLAMKGVSKLPTAVVATKLDVALPGKLVSLDQGTTMAHKLGNGGFWEMGLLQVEDRVLIEPLVTLLEDIRKSKASALEAIAELDRAGALKKTSKHLKKFKEKQYVVRDSVFYCSADGIVTPKTPKVSLSYDTTVEMLPPDPTRGVFPFEVRSLDGHMIVSANTEEERKAWVDTIIGNIAYGKVAHGLLEDVIHVMIWEILQASGMNASQEGGSGASPTTRPENPTSPPTTKATRQLSKGADKKKRLGSFSKLMRKKGDKGK